VSETISGYVRKINTKQGVGKRGPWTLYSVKLTNEDGSAEREPWYSAGFTLPAFAEGDYIAVSVTPGKKEGYFDLDARSVRKATPPAKQEAKQQASAAPAAAKMPATDKDNRIAYQAARNAAIELVDLQIRSGGLPLPKKAPDIYAVVRAAVDKETVQFFNDVTSMRLLETVADGGALEEPPAEAGAAAGDDDDGD